MQLAHTKVNERRIRSPVLIRPWFEKQIRGIHRWRFNDFRK